MESTTLNTQMLEEDLKKAIEHFRSNVVNVLPGQSGILETIVVQAYGTKMQLSELALVYQLANDEVEIKPYDKQLLSNVEQAINNKNIGTVAKAGDRLIFKFPPLTLSLLDRLSKIMKEHFENIKLTIRNIRRTHLDTIKTLQKTNKEFFKKQEDIAQKYIDKYNSEAEILYNKMTAKLTFNK